MRLINKTEYNLQGDKVWVLAFYTADNYSEDLIEIAPLLFMDYKELVGYVQMFNGKTDIHMPWPGSEYVLGVFNNPLSLNNLRVFLEPWVTVAKLISR